jgi:hypothetical protein
MDTGKQALTKPQKKVGVPRKKGRAEEGKGGKLAVLSSLRRSGNAPCLIGECTRGVG